MYAILVLRERLQQEIGRRKAIEETCETERRQRKQAEEMLADLRRESNAPLVIPALMEAFEQISKLTGDALMVIDDE